MSRYKLWIALFFLVLFLEAFVWGPLYMHDYYGYSHEWLEEKVCPIDREVFWGPGGPYVCPKHGVDLKFWVARRTKNGAIEIKEK